MPMFRRRRPLLRAAAVGGGAYAFGKHRQRKAEEEQQAAYNAGQQSGYYEGQQSAMAPAPPPAPARHGLTAEDTQRLGELGKLHDQGVLTDEEFATQKASILGQYPAPSNRAGDARECRGPRRGARIAT